MLSAREAGDRAAWPDRMGWPVLGVHSYSLVFVLKY